MKLRAEQFTQFSKTTPWGYHPQEVEERIEKYEKVIQELSDKLIHKNQNEMVLQERIERLQNELRAMHIEMSSLELPDADEAIEAMVLTDFKNYNSSEPPGPVSDEPPMRNAGGKVDGGGFTIIT